jgi:hypothetical protein
MQKMFLGEKQHTSITFYIFKLRIRVEFFNLFQYIDSKIRKR